MTIRAYDDETKQWSLMWLDIRNPPDLRPLVGAFEYGLGKFYQEIEAPDGHLVQIRFNWDEITEERARWQQAFSFDGGMSWDTNWVMEFTKQS